MRAPSATCASASGVTLSGPSDKRQAPADDRAIRRAQTFAGRPRRRAPPLSLDLRDFEPPNVATLAPSVSPLAATTFQRSSARAVLLPERFRGGCAFGALRSPLGRRRASPARVDPSCWMVRRESMRDRPAAPSCGRMLAVGCCPARQGQKIQPRMHTDSHRWEVGPPSVSIGVHPWFQSL